MPNNTHNSHILNARLTGSRKWVTTITLASAALIEPTNSAHAAQFNFTFAQGTPIEVMSVFWEAGNAWSAQRVDSDFLDIVTDDVSINIFVDYDKLPSTALAGARPGMTRVNYSDFLTQINRDRSSPDDYSASNHLKSGTTFDYLKGTTVEKGETIWLTRANAKALDLIGSNETDFDASIRINSAAPWHYNTNEGVPGDKYDLLTSATHEIGHALGFVSGVDAVDILSQEGTTIDPNLDYVSPMDSVRYSDKSKAMGVPDATNGSTYFSVDGGANNLGDFSTGMTNDGFQVSHWQDGDSRGIMTPMLEKGQRINISDLDLRLLDSIGWDRQPQLLADVKTAMGSIDWRASNPDLSALEKVLTDYLNAEMAKLAIERDAIKDLDPKLWSELQAKAEEEYQKRSQEIQITLGKVLEKRGESDKRLEEALKGASDEQKALADLVKLYGDKLRDPLNAQIASWLNGSSTQLKENLKNATWLQLTTLAATIRDASGTQQTEWKNEITEALRLLYQETFSGQNPTETELNAALAKLLGIAGPDVPVGWSSRQWWWWQTGDSGSSFEQTGEVTYYNSSNDSHSIPEPASTTGLLGLGLLGGSLLLKKRRTKSR
jgi:PEP-CTERM motif